MGRVKTTWSKTFHATIPGTDALNAWVERDAVDYWDFGDYELEVVGMLIKPACEVDLPLPTDTSLPAVLYIDEELSFEPKGGMAESTIWKHRRSHFAGAYRQYSRDAAIIDVAFCHLDPNMTAHYVPLDMTIRKGLNLYWNISTMQKISNRTWYPYLEVTLYLAAKRLITG